MLYFFFYLSDTDSDDEYAYDDALEEPATKEGTMKWAERLMNSYSRKKRDSDSNGYSSSDQSSYYDSSDGKYIHFLFTNAFDFESKRDVFLLILLNNVYFAHFNVNKFIYICFIL